MSYVNLNNPANFQLQEFEQLGFRYIVSGRPTIGGETYRTIFVLTDAVVTATCPNGDSLSSETLVAGTVIHGFFEDVSVASGSLLAYKAGPITAQEIFDAYKAYVYAQGGIVEGESCAVADIAALLEDKLYSAASLVLIPSGYKVSHLYAERPLDSNGDFTFTRASSATRVNSSGLIEKVRTNLVLQSETFSNASWTKSASTITDNATTAPNGTTTADKLIALLYGGTLTQHRIDQTTVSASGSYTFSVYAKKGEIEFISLRIGLAIAYFNLNNGSVSNVSAGIVASSVDAGSGWYRLIITKASATANEVVRINLSPSVGLLDFIGNDTDGAFIWGAQYELNDIATDYIATTTAAVSVGPVANLPRLDYLGSSCGKLLLEGQRTNLALFSEQFDNAVWTKTNATISANATTSPDGYANADSLIDNTTNAVHRINTGNINVTSANAYTLSFFVKKGYVDYVHVEFPSAEFGSNKAVFNIDNGTITSETIANSAKIESYINGWYRCSLTLTATSSGAFAKFYINPSTSSTSTSYIGTNSVSVYLWGAQLEAGAYATSYIPTH
jgi:hypothetical protein